MGAFADLGLIVMDNCESFGRLINEQIVELRRETSSVASYIIEKEEVRFSNGEGKITLTESVRGKDIYIISDVGNHSMTYFLFGQENRKSPDDHLQDIKRVLSSIAGKARRISLVMPLLYASRQHKRRGRESLDCAVALQELEKLGVEDFLVFDVHDPTIQNAVPLVSFENLYPTYEILKRMMLEEAELFSSEEDCLIVSPDTGAMDRAIFYSSILSDDMGLFYKRRDHTKVVHGKNPIIQHEYIGRDVEGMNILIVDDMLSSGESVFDIALELKKRKAKKVIVIVTFALFTEGIDKFQEFYENGLIDKLYTTNLSYIPEKAKAAPWMVEVDLTGYVAKLIHHLNYDKSISDLILEDNGLQDIIEMIHLSKK